VKERNNKRRNRNQTTQKNPFTRIVTITCDLLQSLYIEKGEKERKTAKSGKRSSFTVWSASDNVTTSILRVEIEIDARGGSVRNKTQNKMIEGIKKFANLPSTGDGDWTIHYIKQAPPVQLPVFDEVAWNKRHDDSKFTFRGMELTEYIVNEEEEKMKKIEDRLDKIDMDFFAWGVGKRPLYYKDPKDIKCRCGLCGVQIVLPCFSEDGDYPGGACCPLWCKVENGNEDGPLKMEVHMTCDSQSLAPFLHLVKAEQQQALNEQSKNEEEGEEDGE